MYMLEDALLAVWFLLPAAYGNMAPIFAAHTPLLSRFDMPLDFGKKWHGKPLFGPHKTWRGIVSGMVLSSIVYAVERLLALHVSIIGSFTATIHYTQLPWLLGPLLGFGALAGDALKSLFKRRFNIASGHSWIPFDQLDYIIGAVLISLPFIVLPLTVYGWMFVIWFGLHLLSTYVGWKMGLKSTPI